MKTQWLKIIIAYLVHKSTNWAAVHGDGSPVLSRTRWPISKMAHPHDWQAGASFWLGVQLTLSPGSVVPLLMGVSTGLLGLHHSMAAGLKE